jgi:hypothetical protein
MERYAMRMFQRFSLLLVAAVIGVAAVSAATADKSGAPVSIRMLPQKAVISGGKQAYQHFVVVAQYADGLERDVTTDAKYSLSRNNGQIDQQGRFTPAQNGELAVTARYEGLSAKSTIDVEREDQKHPFSFARDICEIFTKKGCNGTSCHGSVKGKAGFKLSINGMYPHDDYKWIVQGGTYKVLTTDPGPQVPRIDVKNPEKSLLLLKPTFTVPHGGGPRFKVGSPEYETILNWVRAGAPYGEEAKTGSVSIERVEVSPKEVILSANGRRQLLVTAYLTNGQREDMTDDVLYVSNDSDVVDVSDTGVVKAKKTGETAILIRAAGFSVATTVGVIEKPVEHYPQLEARNYIDKYVFAKLRKFNIVPSPQSSDEEFLRRVCLDVAGTLPPAQRVREFVADKDPNKRDHLIEKLLNSPEYVNYWSFRFNDLMRANFVSSEQNYMAHAYEQWVTDSIASNKPYDQMARERIAAQGFSAPARNYYNVQDMQPPETIMPEMVRVFMGRRIECAQCHNHPFEAWSQDQFWGLASFYGGMTELTESKIIVDVLGGGHLDQPKDMMVINPRTKAKVVPAFFDGKPLPSSEWLDPRMALAKWMTANPYFAEASADRIWSYFFGRGIVEPVDDFRSTNPPTHPELLQALADDFRNSGYDVKHMIRTIVQSRTYQLSATTNETNKQDAIDYSHAQPRALEAAILLDAISSATGTRAHMEFHPSAGGGDPPAGMKAVQTMPDICPSIFMDAFGRSSRKALPVGHPTPNLLEAMDMIAGTTYTSQLVQPGGRLDSMLKSGASDSEIIDEFYIAALAREPRPEERASLLSFLNQRSSHRKQALADLEWALISSREFAYNH